MKIQSCNPMVHLIAVFLALVAVMLCETLYAAPVSAVEPEQQASPTPIEITSDSMVTNSQKHAAIFIGNVTATQGKSRLTADQLTIFYKSGSNAESAGTNDIERMEAQGHVRIMFDNKLAVSNQAVYTVKERKLVLEGPDSKVISGRDEIAGSKITFYRDDGRMTLESDDRSRVKAVIHSQQRGLN